MGDGDTSLSSPLVVSCAPGAAPNVARLPPVAIGTAALLNTVKLHHTGSSLFRLMLRADKSLPLKWLHPLPTLWITG